MVSYELNGVVKEEAKWARAKRSSREIVWLWRRAAGGSATLREAMLPRRPAMDTTASPILCYTPAKALDTGSWKSSSPRLVGWMRDLQPLMLQIFIAKCFFCSVLIPDSWYVCRLLEHREARQGGGDGEGGSWTFSQPPHAQVACGAQHREVRLSRPRTA